MTRSNVTHLDLVERQPPANLEAEQALLAAILAGNEAYEDAATLLEPEHFAQAVHGQIFQACGKLIERGERATAVTLKNLFEAHEELAEVGGAEYLAKLQHSYISLAGARDYATAIRDCYLRREIVAAAQEMTGEAHEFDLDGSADDLVDRCEARLQAIRDGAQGGEGLKSLGAVMDGTLARIEEAMRRRAEGYTMGLSTGLYGLDDLTTGLHPSDVTVIAGRPSMGKTAMALGIAHGAASSGARVAVFSLEMTAEQMNQRLLSLRTGISGDRIRKGDLTDGELDELCDERAGLAALPILIDDRDDLTVASMRAAARQEQRRNGLDLVVIDYLQLMEGDDRRYRENRTQEVTAITRGLKRMAKSLDIPVVALSQLSRAVENRDDKRPHLADLRESGSIEQDADIVMFLYREEYYVLREKPQDKAGDKSGAHDERLQAWQAKLAKIGGKADLIVAKNRHGRTGTVTVNCKLDQMRFSDAGQRDMF